MNMHILVNGADQQLWNSFFMIYILYLIIKTNMNISTNHTYTYL